jgi:hypothetical protein
VGEFGIPPALEAERREGGDLGARAADCDRQDQPAVEAAAGADRGFEVGPSDCLSNGLGRNGSLSPSVGEKIFRKSKYSKSRRCI